MGLPAPTIAEVLQLAAAVDLPRAGSRSQGPIEVPEKLWPHVLRNVAQERITGLAVAATRRGSLKLSEVQRSELMARHRSAMGMVLIVERLIHDLASPMAEEGIPTIVLKGAAVAKEFYPDPSWRAYGDLDLLVPAERWAAMSDLLTRLGFRRLIPEPRRGFDERFGKGASFEDPGGRQVDVHRTLALGPFGMWIEPDALIEGTTTFQLGDRLLRRLDDTNALIHACIHAALGRQHPRLLPLRDVIQIAWLGQADWADVAERTRRWRLTAPVAHAMATASWTLGVQVPGPAERILAMPVTPVEHRALRAYTTDRARRGGPSLASLWAIRGFRPRLAFLRAMLFPDRRFLEARSGSRSFTIRDRLVIPIRWASERVRPKRGRHGRSNETG
jgi:Uncharacterised nucleotidyltransferase